MRISAIIPVYNRAELVERAVRSVLSQDLPPGWDLELVVVNDGSTDGTRDVLARLQDGDSRLRVLNSSHGGTPGGARNRGVSVSSGSVLAFLDSDDEWLPGKVRGQIQLGVDFSHTRERWIRDGREISQAGRRFTRYKRSGDLLADSLVKCIIGPSTVMMSRELWDRTGGFRADLEIAEDYEYWLRITTVTGVDYIDQPLTVKYAGHGDQLSEKYGHIERFRLEGLSSLVDSRWFARYRDEPAQKLAQRELSRKLIIYAGGARKRGRLDEARRYEELARGLG